MHGSLSPRRPEVVTDASAFGRDFVATDFEDAALAVAAGLHESHVARGRCVNHVKA
jgi:hypothetical protein